MHKSLYITRWAYVLSLHVLVMLYAMHSALTAEPDMATYAFSLAMAFGVVLCCIVDAQLRGRPILHIVQFLMLFTWPVALPVYLLWSRRWWGLLWCAGVLVSYTVASYLGWFVVVAIVYGAR